MPDRRHLSVRTRCDRYPAAPACDGEKRCSTPDRRAVHVHLRTGTRAHRQASGTQTTIATWAPPALRERCE
eukprot:48598-Eustigmatos_ZCMA.PRE.1